MKPKKQKPSIETEFQLIHDLVAAQVLTQIALQKERNPEIPDAHHQSDDGQTEVVAEAISDEPLVPQNPLAFYFKLARQLRQFFALRHKMK